MPLWEPDRRRGSVATLQELRGRLARCSSWPLRFVVYSSGANLNRRSSCLRLAGTCAFRCPIVMWRNSLPSADFWSTTSPSGGGSNVTPQKFSADCRRGSDRPNDSWRVDETYIRVKGKWVYLYRAV